MSIDDKVEDNVADDVANEEVEVTDAAAETQAADVTEGADEDVADEPAPEPTPEEEVARWRDIATRSVAELENFRKRMAREKQEAIQYANTSLLETLLPVLDNFEFGLQAAKAESENSQVFLGMSMVKKQMDDFLTNQGVEVIQAEGQEFDPNWQDAVGQEASDEVPEGHVIKVVRRGFKMGSRVLRAASVVVSTGAAKEEEADA
ncbi:nucleotide exchange factor GrpE [Sulfuriroseicoccus oceanibius]|uniref:Protein GrpE n=1 Tax=Sulfuriroseicoccus oceanibius TaxID=2707525 RepID=A0A6B3L6X6_9BACT|nr:nucleotide exchange factor GrpE [Sulfuriroseicoccus oceanibius]QQL45085.1 nucleotide exchange factor GrpE [Sulfuriroseicoccus oceanibius]